MESYNNKISYKDSEQQKVESISSPVFTEILSRLQKCNTVLSMNVSELESSLKNISGDSLFDKKGGDVKGKEGIGYAFNINQELSRFEELNSALYSICSSLKEYVG